MARRKNVQEVHLDNLQIKTSAGMKASFFAHEPAKVHRGIVADLDARVIEVRVTGYGNNVIPFEKVRLFKFAGGRAVAEEGTAAEEDE